MATESMERVSFSVPGEQSRRGVRYCPPRSARSGDRDWLPVGGQPLAATSRFLSHFFLILHAGLGLRVVLLTHGTQEPVANRAVYAVAAMGFVVTTALTVAAFGVHFRG
jgi:hypothetical protein